MTVNGRPSINIRPVLPEISHANMDDLLTIRATYKTNHDTQAAQGYVKSTLRSSRSHVKPTNTDRPSSETSLPAKGQSTLCPRCFRPLSADLSRSESVPFHEHSYLLMCRSMGKRDEMEKIAAKFGIRGSTFPPSTRPAKSSIVPQPAARHGHNGVRMLTRQPRSLDGGPKRPSRRTYVGEATAPSVDDNRRSEAIGMGDRRVRAWTNKAVSVETAARDGLPERRSAQRMGRKCTCASGYVDDRGEAVEGRAGLCSGHFCEFSHASPVPVYITPKFMMQNPPRERKHDVGSRRHLSPTVESGSEKRPLSVSRHKKVPPINSQAGAVYINKDVSGHENRDTSTSVNKTTMDVYLPQLCMSQDSDDDDESVMTTSSKQNHPEDDHVTSDAICPGSS